MMVSELIAKLQNAIKDGDREVEFHSYEWTEDLEYMAYQKRNFEEVQRKNGKVRIMISADS